MVAVALDEPPQLVVVKIRRTHQPVLVDDEHAEPVAGVEQLRRGLLQETSCKLMQQAADFLGRVDEQPRLLGRAVADRLDALAAPAPAAKSAPAPGQSAPAKKSKVRQNEGANADAVASKSDLR